VASRGNVSPKNKAHDKQSWNKIWLRSTDEIGGKRKGDYSKLSEIVGFSGRKRGTGADVTLCSLGKKEYKRGKNKKNQKKGKVAGV